MECTDRAPGEPGGMQRRGVGRTRRFAHSFPGEQIDRGIAFDLFDVGVEWAGPGCIPLPKIRHF